MNTTRRRVYGTVAFMLVVSLIMMYFTITPSFADGSGTSSSPFSVNQGIANQGSTGSVEGYIVGKPVSTSSVTTSDFSDDYAIAIADQVNETNVNEMLFVQIPSPFRSEFGLQSNPSLLGEAVVVSGSLTDYFAHTGVKSVSDMELSDGGGSGDPNDPGDGEPSPYDDTYYSSAVGKTGSALKSELHLIIDDHNELTYSEVWDALRVTDEDPANPNNVLLLYSGRSQSKYENGGNVDDWNREHVWAKSHGDFGTSMGPGTDIHHLRPTDVTVNSSRGNLDFDNGGSPQSEAPDNYYDSDSWEPRDSVKGDVARMIFYMAVRYEGDSGEVDLEVNNLVNNGSSPFIGKVSVLKAWNEMDPVDSFEENRNNVIYDQYQHNRNPFIDHPEWVEAIW
ncbi:endonuclease [Anaerobacillus sp. 1_MG-2023]|uniref:endonuclease n=1 Tax=Anaerobacillus sp. 1_MG-2023 TaxID=3062655 RepID=UPI0026E27956|nr:endonuclease [Anaerobacillus sp. 1_MG-2023]MDO6657088.1 endonuclease [Anaerobacillus sp. 1_MG-2023]